ncbi:30S ribosomal protein S4 [Candidatus Berkelbacteria bacterium]|nr:30S ribosomal protein S4 [Candidatus Berkelbacteria bacterium]
MQQGQQKARQKKVSEYGQQLQEKQKTRNAYGMREAQFRRYFLAASKFKGQTGQMLLQILERRLDNAIFRAGMAKTRRQARQMISHRRFTLNGVRISVPSILVSEKDVIAPYSGVTIEFNQDIPESLWLKVDKKAVKATVERLPINNDLPIEFDTQKIIEFYSR